MNRKKKVKQTLLKKAKKSNAKMHKSNKPKYISKADREKMALEEEQAAVETPIEPSDVSE
ncbi:DUF2986 domain-containing protein [Photobacterium damselae]|uniref:DUF2986 domain-containing protein n=5 Tax=Photobacterium damselae TaxID=38293 RepID=D0Z2S4_PHODD|nr:DUF2986 domain-containing protein [Photobacterium damselae]ARR50891.1 DUF2986 domain-containing protein [Photobacterium damselae subsp. damselae]EEZ39705.1 hypothetical protein VDA_000725 [Photobacterium damselae subsp. damselae CIP 102761]EJN6958737.1 DUF2986 domain-containing protein [Photobacterium damselae]ELV7516605.1 DUF2986 domain-containing protein [Photobacterium damselae]KAB1175882.1 DUF2986 domain-containing protein [Photobacterium damselae subsp. damselae]